MFEPNRVPKNYDLDFELVTFFSLSLFSFQRPTTYDPPFFASTFRRAGRCRLLVFFRPSTLFLKSLSLSFSLPNQRDQVDDSSDFADLVKDVFLKVSLFFGPTNSILRQWAARSNWLQR